MTETCLDFACKSELGLCLPKEHYELNLRNLKLTVLASRLSCCEPAHSYVICYFAGKEEREPMESMTIANVVNIILLRSVAFTWTFFIDFRSLLEKISIYVSVGRN